jgi:hypothetical protein
MLHARAMSARAKPARAIPARIRPDINAEQSAEGRCDYAAEIENIDARMAEIIELVRSQGVCVKHTSPCWVIASERLSLNGWLALESQIWPFLPQGNAFIFRGHVGSVLAGCARC